MKRVGLYGGSFDPVHLGHVAVAKAAQVQLGLEQVRWLPAGVPWQKQRALTPAHHRVAMLQLALDVDPAHVIDRREVDRPGPTYTIDTLESLAVDFPGTEWHLILGQDQFAKLHTWHRWQEVVARVHFGVVARSGKLAQVSDEVRPMLPRGKPIEMTPMPFASTEIRRRVAAGGSAAGMVPEAVARYIDRHGLYRQDTAPTRS
jgi:nicotinate-nucleotide adenylyltransferase